MVLGKVLAGEKGRETFLRTGGKKLHNSAYAFFFVCLFWGGGTFFFPITLETACCCVIMLRVSLIAGA